MNPFVTHELTVVRALRKPLRQAEAEYLDMLVRLGVPTWVDAEQTDFQTTEFDYYRPTGE